VFVLQEATVPLDGEAQVWSEVQRMIVVAKPIWDLEAASGHMSVHDWWGTEIIVNVEGL
jgi:hypothetical protein